ncbi:hypothetical protein K438DRAFT_1578500, partial [Mycena galopus ATCC 62051]
CGRELMHVIWRLLLDGDFIEACKHGIVILCPDGTSRRFYFRVFTYSADYPEKVLLASIRNLGRCPCPQCLVTKDKLDQISTIHDDKIRVNSRRNAFSLLTSFGLSIFDMLVPDLMHEFELGVWKATFTHLRILVANGGDSVQGLNDRYRQVPTFGSATIRRFTNNVSAMKKMAARNFEDLLQVSAVIASGHSISIHFVLAEVIRMLGRQLRHFTKVTCAAFTTRELPREEAARGRRNAKKAAAAAAARTAPPQSRAAERRIKRFNMDTYKGHPKRHSLPDYPATILFFGTTNSYSTQSVRFFCLPHSRLMIL